MFPLKFELPQGPASGALWLILALMTLLNALMGVFWIVLGWRAMRAHERLPETLAQRLRAGASAAGSPEPGS